MKNQFRRPYLPTLILAILACILLPTTISADVTIDDQGWTQITPSDDSRIVYVSSSEGDDSNDGLSPDTPKATVLAGNELLRDGYPDHLLLKRGDVFEAEPVNILLGNWKNGRSADEPIVISHYGDSGPRPVVKVTRRLIDHGGNVRNYQAIVGIEIYKSNSDPDSSDFDNDSGTTVLRFVGGGDNLLIEDCVIRFGMTNIQSWGGGVYRNPSFRRNIILDTWGHGSSLGHDGRIQGIFMSGVEEGYVIEENFFDHNGWSEVIEDAGANMFNHNIYVQSDNVEGGIIRGNILTRGASHGLQARSGGIVEQNLLALNAIGVAMGGHKEPEFDEVHEFDNRATRNVVLNGRLMDPDDTSYPRTSAIWGITTDFFHSLLDDNIIANRIDSGNNRAFRDGNDGSHTSVDNSVHNWYHEHDNFDPDWTDPEADLGDYYASLGGENDTIAYLEWLRTRPPGEMPWDMTAYAAMNYIRAGFNKDPVEGYFEYDGESGDPGDPGDPGSANLALGAEVIASDWQDDEWSYQPPELLVDGDTDDESRWSADGFAQWAEIDLGAQYDLAEFRTHPYQSRAYQYTIEVSSDGESWTTAVDRSGNTESAAVLVDTTAASARHVRLTVTGAHDYDGTWVSINELEVFGVLRSMENAALNAAVNASDWQDDEWSFQPPELLVDGDTDDESRWSADGFSQWVELDLGAQYDIAEFHLFPHQERAYQYTIEVSQDGNSFTTAVDRSENTQGGVSLVDETAGTSGRYVRLTVDGAHDYEGTWVSINELEVWGQKQ